MYILFLQVSQLLNCEVVALFVVRPDILVNPALFSILSDNIFIWLES
jgi:hypothetical protein